METLIRIREDTLRGYGIEQELAPRFPDKAARDAEIRRQAQAWAEATDGHALLVLGRAMRSYDVAGRARADPGARCSTCCPAPTGCSRPRCATR